MYIDFPSRSHACRYAVNHGLAVSVWLYWQTSCIIDTWTPVVFTDNPNVQITTGRSFAFRCKTYGCSCCTPCTLYFIFCATVGIKYNWFKKNVVNLLLYIHNNISYFTLPSKLWGVFSDFTLWSVFYLRLCPDRKCKYFLCFLNIILHLTE